MFLGAGVMKRGLKYFGYEFGVDPFPTTQNFAKIGTEGGTILEAKVKELCDTHDAIEVENILCGMGVPCSRVMTYEMMETQPHYVARHTIKEWDAVDGRHLKGVALVPAVTNNPGQIWRGCPTIGMDNEDILSDLGYDKAEIAKLYESGVIRKV